MFLNQNNYKNKIKLMYVHMLRQNTSYAYMSFLPD